MNPADSALAGRIILKRSELGAGWRLGPPPREVYPECPGHQVDYSRFTLTGQAAKTYARPAAGETVGAAVQVFRTRKQAAGDFALGTTPGTARCLRLSVERQLRSVGVSIFGGAAKRAADPRIGERSAEYRVRLRAGAGGRRAFLYYDVVVFLKGRVIGAIHAIAEGHAIPRRFDLARLMAVRTP